MLSVASAKTWTGLDRAFRTLGVEYGGGTAPEPRAELDALLDTAEPLIGTEEARRLRRLLGGR